MTSNTHTPATAQAGGIATAPTVADRLAAKDELITLLLRNCRTLQELNAAHESVIRAMHAALTKLLHGVDAFVSADCRGDEAIDAISQAVEYAAEVLAIWEGQ